MRAARSYHRAAAPARFFLAASSRQLLLLFYSHFLALLPGNACEAAAASRDTHTASLLARTGQFAEGQKGEIKFPEISGKILETVVRYFYYKLKHTNHQGPLPEFKIAPELALELLMAANFLDT